MSRDIVDALADSANDSLNLLQKLIEAVPEDLWSAKAGSWPLWQHVAHVVSGVAGFFLPVDELPFPAPLTAEIVHFKVAGSGTVDKKVISDYLKASQAKLEAFAATLTDADLARPNEKVLPLGIKWNLARSLAILSGHALYHLGHGDALLRGRGLPGIF
ncbi:MAG: DinB family protein [Deltaproteobacteria bacterium]|jgi:uncharacterized damage-inducible protein DinB|nr:DinB family protein [Deltaproteobacteria bacterium]